MIFVTLGSQKFQFNRLLKAIDELQIEEEIFAQIGYSDYKPQNYKYIDFLDREEFNMWEDRANIVITHGGTGAIISALKKGKKVIAIPRLKKFGEHVDDHQVQLIKQFRNLNLIYACLDGDLGKAINVAKNTKFDKYKSNTSRIIRSIEDFIEH
ncbi:PssE/Cps14G family polysaccharide biosynthesis glycosyltransferase [Dubosiella newyorkensis]|uniref:Beta(1,3)galactosyltransferase EpsH n=1 Tax=Dubosiella newyorkensis TaxID=1862672 RepID=A0A1U7NKJ3_9FIRM|nr:PssE/Cps14G family polysaccharide biosynthesis glycosyltransferase [Dubosiella newyorkensis]OLU44774.1 beta(1,3)galactosyltransferase EpsH [Dubosiella newyorkensis]